MTAFVLTLSSRCLICRCYVALLMSGQIVLKKLRILKIGRHGGAQNAPDYLISRILRTEFLVFVGRDFSCAYLGNGVFPPSNPTLGDIDVRADELINNGVIDRDMFNECVEAGLLDDLKAWRSERRFTTSIAICDDIERFAGYRTINANVWLHGNSTAKRE